MLCLAYGRHSKYYGYFSQYFIILSKEQGEYYSPSYQERVSESS